MSPNDLPEPNSDSKINQTFPHLRESLIYLVPATPDQITPPRPFAVLIPPQDRRRVWQDLRAAGYDLPELHLPASVGLLVAILVLLPVALAAFALKNWTVLLSLGELGLLARRITRPWATQPPIGCETVQEAVILLTPFTRADYQAGLWPQEEIAAKVRRIVAQATGVPFAEITDQTRLDDICC